MYASQMRSIAYNCKASETLLIHHDNAMMCSYADAALQVCRPVMME